MSIAVVQAVSVVNTTGTTTAITISSSAAGSLLAITFVGEGSGSQQSVVGVVDNKLNSYSLATNSQVQAGSFSDAEIWYCPNATSGVTTITVTIANSVTSGSCVIGVIEISGAATSSPLEVASTAKNTTGAPVGPALTTANAGSILIATCFPLSTGASGVSSPWTAFTGSLEFNAYYIPGMTGTFTADFIPTTAQAWLSSGASFLPPASGPSGAQQASTFLVL